MIDPSDADLLAAYAQRRDPAAFAALVRRHADLVYNACLRQTRGDRHLADDAAQAVFLLLAQRAPHLKPSVILPGWLYTTARHTAANALRAETRRRRHEQKAAQAMPTTTPPADAADDAAAWSDLAPLLDAAVHALPARDRDALLLRYFQGQSVRDVATALGTSEDAAKQRLSRAVEKLRRAVAARGLTTPAAALTATLLTHTNAHAAPPAVISAACGFALPTAVTSASVSSIAKTTLFLTHMKTLATTTVAAATLLIATATTVLLLHGPALSDPPAPTPTIPVADPPPTPPATPPDPQARLTAAYALKDNEFLRLVRPPFPPERAELVVKRSYVGPIPAAELHRFGTTVFRWTPTGQLRQWSFRTYSGYVGTALSECLGLARYQMEIPVDLLRQPMIGDWVVRYPSPFDDRLRALEPFLHDLPKPVRLQKRQEEREVIVVTGIYQLRPLPGLPNDRKIHLGTGDLAHPQVRFLGAGGGTGDFAGFLRVVAGTINQYVIDETLDGARPVSWANEDTRGADDHDDNRDSLLDNLAQQTSLRFTRQRRMVDIWYHLDNL